MFGSKKSTPAPAPAEPKAKSKSRVSEQVGVHMHRTGCNVGGCGRLDAHSHHRSELPENRGR